MLLVVVLTAIILMFTLFKLKKVDVQLKTETNVLTEEIIEEIKEDTLKQGGSVLFVGKEKIIFNLEQKFPYLKIVNIETKIPNKFVIHCLEREEFFAIESQGKTYYLDEELKILRIKDGDFEKQENGAVLLKLEDLVERENGKIENVYLDLNLQNANEGQFVKLSETNIQKIAVSILSGFEANNRQLSTVRSLYNKFDVFYKAEVIDEEILWHACLRLEDRSGYKIEIVDANENLAEKIGVMFEAISSTKPQNLIGKTIVVYKNLNNQFVYSFNG